LANSSIQPNIAIIILAAGASKRMGSPKQLLKWGDTTLLGHCVYQAIKSDADEVFVVLGANYEKIKNSITQPSVTILKNNDWEKGIGNSISHGILHIQDQGFGGVLIMLVDQPQINTNFLNTLITQYHRSQKPIIATDYKKNVGVPAIFDSSYFDKLGKLSGDRGAKQLIEKHIKDTLILSSPNSLADIDTMEDYSKTSNLYDR
jgi:molybdenum cofactor cytidylyltransferase